MPFGVIIHPRIWHYKDNHLRVHLDIYLLRMNGVSTEYTLLVSRIVV